MFIALIPGGSQRKPDPSSHPKLACFSEKPSTGKIFHAKIEANIPLLGQVHLSSGYGRRLASKGSWVQIHAPDIGWTFFHT